MNCWLFRWTYKPFGLDISEMRETIAKNQWQYIRDSGIWILANELSEISTPRILLFRSKFQCTDTQIKYTFYQTKSFIVLCCLHFSIFVHTFLLFRSHRGAAEIVYVVVPRFRTPWTFSYTTPSRCVAMRLDDPGLSV